MQRLHLHNAPTTMGCQLLAIEAKEGLSMPFEFSCLLASQHPSINWASWQQQGVTFGLSLQNDQQRIFQGYVTNIIPAGNLSDGIEQVRLTLQPWTYYLSRNQHYRSFNDLSVLDIIKEILAKYSFAKINYDNLHQTYAPLTYCAQYSESDFDFIERLLADAGIFYYFSHDNDGHTLQLGDHAANHFTKNEPFLLASEIFANASSQQLLNWQQHLSADQHRVIYDAFNAEHTFPMQSATAVVNASLARQLRAYPLRYNDALTDVATITKQHQQQHSCYYNGSSTEASLLPNQRFQLLQTDVDNIQKDTKQEAYLVTAITHSAHDYSQLAPHLVPAQFCIFPQSYNNTFVAIPDRSRFYAKRITKKHTNGAQRATVNNSQDKSVVTSAKGEVRCHFHWQQNNNNRSCYMPTMQRWASHDRGWHLLPRHNSGSLIAYLQGDPAQPIMIGQLYNQTHKPIFPLPEKQYLYGLQTSSIHSGTEADATKIKATHPLHHLLFDDTQNTPGIRLKSAGDLQTQVDENMMSQIQHNQLINVGQGNYDINNKGRYVLNADQALTFKVGNAQLIIRGDMITLQAMNISLN